MKKFLIFTMLIFGAALSGTAQVANKMSSLVDSKNATYGDLCYLCASSLELLKETDSDAEAVKILVEKNIAKNFEASKILTLKDASFVLKNTFDVKGSLLLVIFNTPRYAFKQLKADGIIGATDDPSKKVTGHELLGLMTNCLNTYGNK